MIPVRSGQAHFVGTSNTVELASVGKSPLIQAIGVRSPSDRSGALCQACGIGVYVPEKSNIQTIADLAGKRVTYITGNDSANLVGEAILPMLGLPGTMWKSVYAQAPRRLYGSG